VGFIPFPYIHKNICFSDALCVLYAILDLRYATHDIIMKLVHVVD